MKLEVKVNFDFGKLSRNMPKIIREYVTEYAKGTEEGSKSNIDKGIAPALKDSTKDIRKLRKVSGAKPLKATGALYNSIKSSSSKIQFLKYGQYHREGFTPKKIPTKVKDNKVFFVNNKNNISVPARDFVGILNNTRNKISKNFRDKVKRALKK